MLSLQKSTILSSTTGKLMRKLRSQRAKKEKKRKRRKQVHQCTCLLITGPRSTPGSVPASTLSAIARSTNLSSLRKLNDH